MSATKSIGHSSHIATLFLCESFLHFYRIALQSQQVVRFIQRGRGEGFGDRWAEGLGARTASIVIGS